MWTILSWCWIESFTDMGKVLILEHGILICRWCTINEFWLIFGKIFPSKLSWQGNWPNRPQMSHLSHLKWPYLIWFLVHILEGKRPICNFKWRIFITRKNLHEIKNMINIHISNMLLSHKMILLDIMRLNKISNMSCLGKFTIGLVSNGSKYPLERILSGYFYPLGCKNYK